MGVKVDELIDSYILSNPQNVININEETREIEIDEEFLAGVENDERTERIYFTCPKVVGDNIDLTQYDLYINYKNANEEVGSYLIEDVETSDENSIKFTWVLSRNATKYKGSISFIVCAKKTQSNGDVTNEWNTTVAKIKVLEGIEVNSAIEEQNADVIEQILTRLKVVEDNSNDMLVYTNLSSKPKINGVELVGNKTTKDLKIDTSSVLTININTNETGGYESDIEFDDIKTVYESEDEDDTIIQCKLNNLIYHLQGYYETDDYDVFEFSNVMNDEQGDKICSIKLKQDSSYEMLIDYSEQYVMPLQVANSSQLGGVMPIAKTSDMTQEVGIDENGLLYTEPQTIVGGGYYSFLNEIDQSDFGEILEIKHAFVENNIVVIDGYVKKTDDDSSIFNFNNAIPLKYAPRTVVYATIAIASSGSDINSINSISFNKDRKIIIWFAKTMVLYEPFQFIYPLNTSNQVSTLEENDFNNEEEQQ